MNDKGTNIRLFANGTSLSISVENPIMAAVCINTDLLKLSSSIQKKELDKIPNEAARIATGATKHISIERQQDKVKWQPLQKRKRPSQTYPVLQNELQY